jgi:hypothetical protein
MPTATYIPLANITLGSTAATVTFSSIPSTFRDLVLVINGTLVSSVGGDLTAILNSDTGGNYSRVFMGGDTGSAFSYKFTGETTLRFGYMGDGQHLSITNFMDYSATDKHKTVLSRSNNSNGAVFAWASRWANNSAITSMILDTTSANSFTSGSNFALYGIAS